MVKYKDTELGGFVLDSECFECLSCFENQIKYQTELLTCFFNQQPDFSDNQDLSPATNRVKIETKSMTNLTSDDEINPFLIFLKCKTEIILPSQVSKKRAKEIWADYKKAINKMLPTIRSHINSQNCNITVLLDLLARFIIRKGGSLQNLVRNMDLTVDFAVEYMMFYYQIEMLSKQCVDLSQVFRFAAYQVLFKQDEISILINEAVNAESFSQGKQIVSRFNEIVTLLKQIPKVAHYLEKKSAQEKADIMALLTDKKSIIIIIRHVPKVDSKQSETDQGHAPDGHAQDL